MEKQFWNTRYIEHCIVYGTEPNRFFKEFIDTHKPGSILLPADAEGRNAIYAAKQGWQVDAFDFSEAAVEKATKRSIEEGVSLNYWVEDINDFKASKEYDAVGLIYVHLPADVRQRFHEQVYKSLQSGGYLVLEAFSKEQATLGSGGPSDKNLLYDALMICSDFPFLQLLHFGQKSVVLNEGQFHSGKAEVLGLVGQRL